MNVAMSRQRANARLVANGDAAACVDSAKATEPKFWELLLPRVEQRHRVLARDREQQFEILAIGQCGDEGRFGRITSLRGKFRRAADGNRALEQFRSHVTGLEKMPQIARQSVADVHQGVDGKMFS